MPPIPRSSCDTVKTLALLCKKMKRTRLQGVRVRFLQTQDGSAKRNDDGGKGVATGG